MIEPLLFALLAVVVGLGMAYWQYARATTVVTGPLQYLLTGLRGLTIATALFVLLVPLVRLERTIDIPPEVLIYIDNSASVRVTAAGRDSALQESIEAVETLFTTVDIPRKTYLFGGQVAGQTTLPDSFFTASETRMDAVMEHAVRHSGAGDVRAVVIAGDGRFTSGRSPVGLARELSLPVYTLVLGDTLQEPDARVVDLAASRFAYVGGTIQVDAALDVRGMQGQTIPVSLAFNGAIVADSLVQIDGPLVRLPLSFTIEAASVGRAQLDLVIEPDTLDSQAANNAAQTSIDILDRRRRVLLVAGGPTPDAGFVRRVLELNPDLAVETRIQRDARQFYEGPLADVTGTIDAAIVIGFPSADTDPDLVASVAAQLETTQVAFMWDGQVDAARLGPLVRFLPAQLTTNRPTEQPVSLAWSGSATTHAISRDGLLDAFDRPDLSPLSYTEGRWTPMRGAEVLATVEIQGVPVPDPLIVAQRRSGRRSVALLASGWWQWGLLPDGSGGATSPATVLLNEIIGWITAPEEDKPVRVRAAQSRFASNEVITIRADVSDEELRPISTAQVQVTVERTPAEASQGSTAGDTTQVPTDTDFRPQTLLLTTQGDGRYQGRIAGLPDGAYNLTGRASEGDRAIGSDEASFSVGGLTVEYLETTADAALMDELARRTGGTRFFARDVDQLIQAVAQTGNLAPRQTTEIKRIEPRRITWFLVVMILLLSTEWFLRKKNGLS